MGGKLSRIIRNGVRIVFYCVQSYPNEYAQMKRWLREKLHHSMHRRNEEKERIMVDLSLSSVYDALSFYLLMQIVNCEL